MKRWMTWLFDNPARLAIAVGLIVLLTELLIMLLIESVSITIFKGRVPSLFWGFVDPILLTVIVSPALYILIFRPLRNQQRLLRVLSETVASGVILHRGGKLINVNPAMVRLTGFTSEELLSMDYWEVAHHDSDSREQLRARGEAMFGHFEYRINSKSGGEVWATGESVAVEYQSAPAVLATFVDITERKHAEAAQRHAQQVLAQIIDGDPVPTFVIDQQHRITHWNKSCQQITGACAADMVGTCAHHKLFYDTERPTLADLIVNGAAPKLINEYYGDKRITRFSLVQGAYEAEDYFPAFGVDGCWLHFTAAPLSDAEGRLIGAIETLQDVTDERRAEDAMLKARRELEELAATRGEQLSQATAELKQDIARRQHAEAELLQRFNELSKLHVTLEETQQQLLQSEKLASIGQLAAGVAHEINNPIGFVQSNMGSLENYLNDLFRILDAYAGTEESLSADLPARAEVWRLKDELDLDFLREDIPKLMTESRDGITRVSKIVQDLKDFSHVDTNQEWKWADVHKGLDSTLNVASNEIKYKADVVKEYGTLPEIECLPSEINQVFLNLLVNAAHAIVEGGRGTITLRSGCDDRQVWIEVTDTGSGIAPENLKRIFDPFFTTKPVGKGTGLGLSLSYGIVKKHHGSIEVKSEPGKGTTFRIILPVQQSEAATNGGTQL